MIFVAWQGESTSRRAVYMRIHEQRKLSGYWPSFSPEGKQRVCDQLAKFIWSIHNAVPLAELDSFGFPKRPYLWHEPDTMRATIDKHFRNHRWTDFAFRCVNRHEQYLSEKKWHRLLHRDIHGNNVVVNPQKESITGVFDFEDVVVSDLHQDFYPFTWVGYDAMEQLVAAYESLSGINLDRQRIRDYRAIDRIFSLVEGVFGEELFDDLNHMQEMEDIGS